MAGHYNITAPFHGASKTSTTVSMDFAFTYERDFKKTTKHTQKNPNTTAQTSLISQDMTAKKNGFHHTS